MKETPIFLPTAAVLVFFLGDKKVERRKLNVDVVAFNPFFSLSHLKKRKEGKVLLLDSHEPRKFPYHTYSHINTKQRNYRRWLDNTFILHPFSPKTNRRRSKKQQQLLSLESDIRENIITTVPRSSSPVLWIVSTLRRHISCTVYACMCVRGYEVARYIYT